MTRIQRVPAPRSSVSVALVAGVAALGAAALTNAALARRAERRNPPTGRFVTVRGVRLHVVERGSGTPLVLLHGNGTMIQDFESSGLIDDASERYRVIAFDRPGFGHSSRPRAQRWSPQDQADLFAEALERMDVGPALVLGHSWGTTVAVALALHHPDRVRGLVLASGYYFPTTRPDFAMLSSPSTPVLGGALRHTVLPFLSRAIWPLLLRHVFGPRSVPRAFEAFPKEMAVRPSQLRAAAEETALLLGFAHAEQDGYGALTQPVAVIAGGDDRLIDPQTQSAQLAHALTDSSLHVVEGHGHMVHQTAPSAMLDAIDEVDRRATALAA